MRITSVALLLVIFGIISPFAWKYIPKAPLVKVKVGAVFITCSSFIVLLFFDFFRVPEVSTFFVSISLSSATMISFVCLSLNRNRIYKSLLLFACSLFFGILSSQTPELIFIQAALYLLISSFAINNKSDIFVAATVVFLSNLSSIQAMRLWDTIDYPVYIKAIFSLLFFLPLFSSLLLWKKKTGTGLGLSY